jgi:dephospho-CoA kinase
MGKSTCAQILGEMGLPVVDTDLLARQLVMPGSPALAEICATFGDAVLDATGQLCRATLANLVFSDESRRRALEAILHPRIREAWQVCAEDWRRGGSKAGVVVIPLLFETGTALAFNHTVCVACLAASQQERLAARGWTAAMAASRIAAQWPVERKMAASGHVVWTEGRLESTVAQLRLLAARLELDVHAPAPRL